MKRITINLADQQLTELQQLSDAKGLPLSEMLRRLLDTALEHEKEKQRRDINRSTTRHT